MPYALTHVLANQPLQLHLDDAGYGTVAVRCTNSGRLRVRYAGVLTLHAIATYTVRVWVEEVGPNSTIPDGTIKGRWRSQIRTLPLTMTVRTPDGLPFTRNEVTLADLARFRNLRGVTQGDWSFSVSGQSAPVPVAEEEAEVVLVPAKLRIVQTEAVLSKSAPPLVNGQVGEGVQSFRFDLFRLGRLEVRVAPTFTLPFRQWQGQLRLLDPVGNVVATAAGSFLSYEVTPQAIDKSRDPQGHELPWTLEAVGRGNSTRIHRVMAQVTATTRVHTNVLQDRINVLLGPNGNKLRFTVESRGKKLVGRLKILDELSAETLDMYGLLDGPVRKNPQDAGIDTDQPDIKANVAYSVFSTDEGLGHGLRIISSGFRVKALQVNLGASQRIQPAVPALRVTLQTEGELQVRVGGFALVTLKPRNNQMELELGLKPNAQGGLVPVAWLPDSLLDLDLHWEAALVLGLLTGGLLTLGAAGVLELVEGYVNRTLRSNLIDNIDSGSLAMPFILAILLGDDFTYTNARLEGNDLALSYIAPKEHDPRPSQVYRGVIGRSVNQLGPDVWQMTPRMLGDTWAADNLAKVKHIVVVMMENRSFDHVLGYRAQGAAGGDGLTPELLQALSAEGYNLPALGQSNLAVKTQFPVAVGHELDDVTEQLAKRVAGPNGRFINSPEGFVSNFKKRLDTQTQAIKDRVKQQDVLGYYQGADLPAYKFLADNFAWCDQYYCSHAGPTLPNRMFSLTGDVQYDRAGEAIVDSNNGDNFYLSRSTTIYDLFNRKGLDWRVYESFPSVTMLRMFARYATDSTHIVPISRLAQDVAAGNLPPLTVIEPAMHHFPQNDDHPVADMRNGQAFVADVYNTLRSNTALWRDTLLIVTYDEHGGFYDHVIPPVADLRDFQQFGSVEPGSVTSGGGASGGVVKPGGGTSGGVVKPGGVTPGDVVSRGPSKVEANPPAQVDSGLLDGMKLGLSPLVLTALPSLAVQGDPITQDCLTPYGLRVPTFVVSPWVPPGKGPAVVLDHCSILKTILARFIGPSAPFLSDRVAMSHSFNDFLSLATPRLETPVAPMAKTVQRGIKYKGRAIATPPLRRAQMRDGNVAYHDLTGRLARMLGR